MWLTGHSNPITTTAATTTPSAFGVFHKENVNSH